MITMVIAATRTYRALTYYVPTPTNTTYDILSFSIPHAHCFPGYPSGPDSSNARKSIRFVTSTEIFSGTFEEYPMSDMNRYPSPDARLADKPPRELGLDDNV